MVSQRWKLRWANFKLAIRDWTHVISGAGLAFGAILTVLAVLAIWFPDALSEEFKEDFMETSGRLDICSAGGGLLLLIFAGYYFADNMNNRRKFNRLFHIASKEKFIKNRDKLEELAFFISTRHERMVQKKIKEMKLR
ncbi:MAG: hypothetical protein FJ149_09465 [Euryarchaeota archaeon]|nr:hypothetical protein [Euryarchaeota archaeon]